MSPAFTFFIGLLLLILFGWYFATDYGLRKRLIATLLAAMLVAFSIATIWPPDKKIESAAGTGGAAGRAGLCLS